MIDDNEKAMNDVTAAGENTLKQSNECLLN